MDDELRNKKESLADTAEIESILEEEAELMTARCIECGGQLLRVVSTNGSAAVFVLKCEGCGCEY